MPRMRLFLLTVEVFMLTVRLFCLRRGNHKQKKRPNPISGRGGELQVKKRPNRFPTVSRKDQTLFQPQVNRTKPIVHKQQRPTVSNKDLTVSKNDLLLFKSKTPKFEWTQECHPKTHV